MASTDLDQRSFARPPPGLADDLPRWRDRLERQWRLQVEVAHQLLAEIEAALGRIDAASYGICEQCGLRLKADWLEASPQIRYCPECCVRRCGRRESGPAAGLGTS